MSDIKKATFERYNSLYELRRIESDAQVRIAEVNFCREIYSKDDPTDEAIKEICVKMMADRVGAQKDPDPGSLVPRAPSFRLPQILGIAPK